MINKHTVTVHQNASFATNLETVSFQHQQFTDFSGHNKEIKKCDFSYAFFQRAYFRKVKFIECDFTGAKFFDSNLRDAEFINCKFPYAIFKFTIISSQQVLNNLPEWPNVRIYLLQNHKANANSFGDIKAVRTYLLAEIDSNKEHLRRARKRTEGYYATKYRGFWIRARIFWKSALLYVDDLSWGHGESPWKIARNVVVVILGLSVVQAISRYDSSQTLPSLLHNFWRILKSDIKTFVGITVSDVGDMAKVILILLRYLTLGLFIRVLFNKYSWR
jgi:hypothetical protein